MPPALWLSLCPLVLALVAIAIAGRLRKWRWARMARICALRHIKPYRPTSPETLGRILEKETI